MKEKGILSDRKAKNDARKVINLGKKMEAHEMAEMKHAHHSVGKHHKAMAKHHEAIAKHHHEMAGHHAKMKHHEGAKHHHAAKGKR